MSATSYADRSSAPRTPARRSRGLAVLGLSAAVASLLIGGLATAGSAAAATASVGLGTAASYSVLGGSAVTNTGPSRLNGDLGVSPGTAISGFPPGLAAGTIHAADAVASQAKASLVTAYNDAAGRAPTASVAGDLVGRTLTDGVYKSSSSLALSGTITLDGQGNPNSVFIFQVASTLITASASSVNVINGAQACHVFWQVGSSATLGTASSFKGTIMALTSVTLTTGAAVQGRALARNGKVALDNNVFTSAACDAVTPTTAAPVPVTTAPTATTAPPAGTATATAPRSTPASTLTPRSTPASTLTPRSTPASTLTPRSTSAVSTPVTTASVAGPGVSGPGTGTGTGTGVATRFSTFGANTGTPGELANTGAMPLGPPLGAGALLLLTGGGLLLAGRRRTVARVASRRH